MTAQQKNEIGIPVVAEEPVVVSVPVKTVQRKRVVKKAPRLRTGSLATSTATPKTPEASHDLSRQRMVVWIVTGVLMVAIVGAWIALFRWNTRGAMKEDNHASDTTANELRKSVDEFQKNFSSITKIIEDRFSEAKPDNQGTTQLSPEALRELQSKLNTANTPPEKQAEQSAAPTPQMPASIDFNVRTWQPYASEEPPLQLRYPKGWVLDTTVVAGIRLAAFARGTKGASGMSELFVDMHTNTSRKTLKEFYAEKDRTNLYQAARGGTETVYVDGIRAIQFNDVAQVLPTTVVSVRSGTKVYEFSVLGTDAEHMKLLQTFLSTVQFK